MLVPICPEKELDRRRTADAVVGKPNKIWLHLESWTAASKEHRPLSRSLIAARCLATNRSMDRGRILETNALQKDYQLQMIRGFGSYPWWLIFLLSCQSLDCILHGFQSPLISSFHPSARMMGHLAWELCKTRSNGLQMMINHCSVQKIQPAHGGRCYIEIQPQILMETSPHACNNYQKGRKDCVWNP